MHRENRELAEDRLPEVLDYWVRNLGLQSWNIRFSWLLPDEGSDCGQAHTACEMGETLCDGINHEGLIKLRRWSDFCPKSGEAYDMEEALVHELLHCCFDLFWVYFREDGFAQMSLHERIDQLSWSLVDAKRAQDDVNAGNKPQ